MTEPSMPDNGADEWHLSPRASALRALAQYHGVDLDRQLLAILAQASDVDPVAMVRCLREAGLRAKAMRPSWSDLVRLAKAGIPTMLVLTDGGAAILDGYVDKQDAIFLKDPLEPVSVTAIDQHRLARFWTGVIVVAQRAKPGDTIDGNFTPRWLLQNILHEKRLFRDIGIASIVLSALALVVPLSFMTVVDRVLLYQSWQTLTLLAMFLGVALVHEMLLGHARRHLISVTAGRIDAKIGLFLFSRLLGLPMEYFEKHPAGQITYNLYQANRIREFLTGHLFKTVLDSWSVILLLPVLFFLHAGLTWMVLGCTLVLALVTLSFLPSVGRATAAVIEAETKKSIHLGETVQGMRTVKALALEPRQADIWNENVAAATERRLQQARVTNWAQTLADPVQRFIQVGTMVIGAYLALTDGSFSAGQLFAYVLLSQRVAAPLVALVGLIDAQTEVRDAFASVAAVVNTPPERPAALIGARPHFSGRVTFDNVRFAYPGAKTVALDKVSFDIPAGTLLGVVGRSGSGKSTITRLLQGLNSGYSGTVKIDGVELREIDLSHLRKNLGIVLQDNFLFRGTIRENIAAGRPGITFEKVVRAARLAGAEEFIERLPNGLETFIEEGSANLSGGQRQRLAIARAIVTEPTLMIMDEATSALDPESEAIVNANLLRIARGRTVIVVSHRLSSLVDADAILVLDRGQIEDCGPHEVLLQRCAIYRNLWQQQNRTPTPKRLIDVAHSAATGS